MRVRIRRFEKLRSVRRQPGHPERIEVLDRHGRLERAVSGQSPPATSASRPRGEPVRYTPGSKFPIDRSPPLPVLQLDRSQSAVDPLVQILKDPRRIRPSEILSPAEQVLPEHRDDLTHAPSAAPAGDLPDTLLELAQGLGRHAELHRPSRGDPETVAEELSVPHPRHRALLLVDPKPEPRIESPQGP